MTDTGIGASVRRVEDQRFITGRGNYVDDIKLAGQCHAVFVRSDQAHAELKGVDTAQAASAPGVIAVLTGADVAADGLGGLPCGWGITSIDGNPMIEPPWPILAQERVRFVGDAIAVVIAESRSQALDAAELVEVSYNPLPAIIATADANKDGAPQVWPDAKNNTCFHWAIGEKEPTDKAFAEGWIKPQPPATKTGKRVAIVGSGPAGLAAAQQLARAGHDVHVYEKNAQAGGLLRYGIPDFKMEKYIVERRVTQMEAEGVTFFYNVNVGHDVRIQKLELDYDAVLLSGGAEQPRAGAHQLTPQRVSRRRSRAEVHLVRLQVVERFEHQPERARDPLGADVLPARDRVGRGL